MNKPVKFIIAVGIISISFLANYLFLTKKKSNDKSYDYSIIDRKARKYLSEVMPNYEREYVVRSNFQTKVQFEKDNKITFPKEFPTKAYIHFDSETTPKMEISNSDIILLLEILNDSTVYQWGELGTPYFDRLLTFHNESGKCVGYTTVSYDGQTYCKPSLAIMKWGLFGSTKRFNKLVAILEEY